MKPVEEASHVATLGPRLAQLAKRGDCAVQEAVAHNEKTPPSTLKALAQSSDSRVRLSVAQNKMTDLDVRRRFMLDEPELRVVEAAVAGARPKERDALRRLASSSSKHSDVRLAFTGSAPRPASPTAQSACPTPTKTRYPTKLAALGKGGWAAKRIGKAVRVYRCPCGAWHHTTKVKRLS